MLQLNVILPLSLAGFTLVAANNLTRRSCTETGLSNIFVETDQSTGFLRTKSVQEDPALQGYGQGFWIQPVGCAQDLEFTALAYPADADQGNLIEASATNTLYCTVPGKLPSTAKIHVLSASPFVSFSGIDTATQPCSTTTVTSAAPTNQVLFQAPTGIAVHTIGVTSLYPTGIDGGTTLTMTYDDAPNHQLLVLSASSPASTVTCAVQITAVPSLNPTFTYDPVHTTCGRVGSVPPSPAASCSCNTVVFGS